MAQEQPIQTSSKEASMASPMSIQVSGKHVNVGDALRKRITDELIEGVGKYFERGGDADVAVGKEGHSFCVDILVRLASGQKLEARGLGGDAHAAFDAALSKLETRVRRYKRRLKNHHLHPGGKAITAELATLVVLRSDEAGDFDDAWAEEADSSAPAAMVIAEMQASVKTMPVSMAVMELDLSDAPVILFRNAGHGGLSVVYRRTDGNVGWIDPERMPLGGSGPAVGGRTPAQTINGAAPPARN
jgi:ribosomal subunit interface protein